MFAFRNNADNTGVTVELRQIVESGVDIWNFAYPSYYTGEEKKAFEQKVIDHYFFRQIGQETVGRWLHYFRTRIREIMPYYIKMYETVELMDAQEDPFEAYNLREEFTEERQNTGTTSESSERSDQADSTRKHSDTPQGSITNVEKYMSEGTLENSEIASSGSSSGSSENTGTTHYTLTRKGNIGVQPLGKEVEALRDALINVDQMIINELNDLFLLVY